MAVWYSRNVRNANGTWGSGNFLTQSGPVANATGALGTISGNAGGSVTQPTTRYFCSSVFNADGTNAVNGILCYLMDPNGSKNIDYPNGLATINHPGTHPTQANLPGWICFSHFALPSDQINHEIMILDQVNTVGLQTGVTVPIPPQLTNTGNG